MNNKYINEFGNKILFSKIEYQKRVKKIKTKMANEILIYC